MADEKQSAWGIVFDRLLDSVDVIVTRITSGRFIITVLVVYTYCKAVDMTCVLVKDKVVSVETFLAVLGGILGLTTMMVKDLFQSGNMKDKQGEDNGKNNPVPSVPVVPDGGKG